VSKLLSWGADIEARNNEGLTPLHVAIKEEHPKIFSLLLNAGADLDAKGRPEYSQSPVSAIPHPYTGGGYGPQSSYQIMQRSKESNRTTQVNSVL
jgi:ankyrin repeat protein